MPEPAVSTRPAPDTDGVLPVTAVLKARPRVRLRFRAGVGPGTAAGPPRPPPAVVEATPSTAARTAAAARAAVEVAREAAGAMVVACSVPAPPSRPRRKPVPVQRAMVAARTPTAAGLKAVVEDTPPIPRRLGPPPVPRPPPPQRFSPQTGAAGPLRPPPAGEAPTAPAVRGSARRDALKRPVSARGLEAVAQAPAPHVPRRIGHSFTPVVTPRPATRQPPPERG